MNMGLMIQRFFLYQKTMDKFTRTEYEYGYLGFGICGSVCTAICLSYLNNNFDNQIIVNEPYSFIDGNFAKWLIHLLNHV